MDKDSKYTEGRGLQIVLPHALSYAGRTIVLDTPQR